MTRPFHNTESLRMIMRERNARARSRGTLWKRIKREAKNIVGLVYMIED
jgi:hypothetical protein